MLCIIGVDVNNMLEHNTMYIVLLEKTCIIMIMCQLGSTGTCQGTLVHATNFVSYTRTISCTIFVLTQVQCHILYSVYTCMCNLVNV